MSYAHKDVDIKSIESEVPHSERGTIIDPHGAKQKSKMCPGIAPPDIPLQGSGDYRESGKGMGRGQRM